MFHDVSYESHARSYAAERTDPERKRFLLQSLASVEAFEAALTADSKTNTRGAAV